jgi:hypothetical protein
MKEYRIIEGGTVYSLTETAEDLGIVRYAVLKNIITEESSGMKFPDIIQWFDSRRQYYNQNDMYALLTSEINLVKQVEENHNQRFNDASHRIFSLMVSEPNEDITDYDSTRANEKLERMAKEGLTQREVLSVTANFISASPELSNSFFLMSLAAMQKTLKSSEPMLQSLSDSLEVQALLKDTESENK